MCYVDKYDLVYPDGTYVPQCRVIPCVHGTAEQPCGRRVERRQPPVHTMPVIHPAPVAEATGPQYVEIAPPMRRSNTTAGPTLRDRRGRGRNNMRLEFELHIPFTSRDDKKKERPASAYPVSAGHGPIPPPPLPPLQRQAEVDYYLARPQAIPYTQPHDGQWHNWNPRIVTIDPAVATPPATPQSSRRSRSEGPSPAGREHVRGHSRQRSGGSSIHRPSAATSPAPSRPTTERNHVEERIQRLASINERLARLERERTVAQQNQARDERIAELDRRIDALREQSRRPSRIVETHHQDGRRTTHEAVREPARGGAGGGRSDFLRNTGRRAIQRDIEGRVEERRDSDDDGQARRQLRPRAGTRARITGPEKETNTFARMFGLDGRRSESRRRDRQTERIVYAEEGSRSDRWH